MPPVILQILVLLTVIIYAEGRGARMAALISDHVRIQVEARFGAAGKLISAAIQAALLGA